MQTTYTILDHEVLRHAAGETRAVTLYDAEVEPGRFAYQIWVKVLDTTFDLSNVQTKIAECASVIDAAKSFQDSVQFLKDHNYEGTFS
jgi:hypothetical protein